MSDTEPSVAAPRLAGRLRQDRPALVLLFVSSRLDVEALVAGVAAELPDHEIVGCTTAGEIAPTGFHEGTAVGISLGGDVAWAVERVAPLSSATPLDARRAIEQACENLDGRSCTGGGDRVGLVLGDGLQRREEMLMAWLAAAAPGLPLVGASASDDFAFERALVWSGGAVDDDAALVVLLRLGAPFQLLNLQHFRPTQSKVVVTGVLTDERVVTEIDGYPAIEAYARLLGEPPGALTRGPRYLPPFAYTLQGDPYIRSVIRAEDGVGLHFACAVEEGVVLTLMEPGDLVESTRVGLARARRAVGGEIRALIAFNCLGRLLEARAGGLTDALAGTFRDLPVAGFHTYGEQFYGLHVNHTLTGLVVGERGRR